MADRDPHQLAALVLARLVAEPDRRRLAPTLELVDERRREEVERVEAAGHDGASLSPNRRPHRGPRSPIRLRRRIGMARSRCSTSRVRARPCAAAVSMSVPDSASGITILPPGASCSSRLGGGAGAVAWTAIASNGARSGAPRVPSPTRISTLSSPSASIRLARLGRQTLEALDAEHLAPRAARGSPPSSRSRCRSRAPARRPRGQRLADRGHDPRLGDRLAVADRQRRVGVGAAPEPLGDEQLSRDRGHRRQHRSSAIPRRRSWRSTMRSLAGRRQRLRRCRRAGAWARARSPARGPPRPRPRARAWRGSG